MLEIIYEVIKGKVQEYQCFLSESSNHFVVSQLVQDLNFSPTEITLRKGQQYVKAKTSLQLSICQITHCDVYKNPNLQINLIVTFGRQQILWLTLSQSSIPCSGFGVFAGKDFEKNELVTVYLGTEFFDNSSSTITYALSNITVPKDPTKINGIMEEYWLAHRIQHGSGNLENVIVKKDFTVIAKRRIKKGEELFFDYRRPIICPNCKEEQDYLSCDSNDMENCVFCFKSGFGKKCIFCGRFICKKHYDETQIN